MGGSDSKTAIPRYTGYPPFELLESINESCASQAVSPMENCHSKLLNLPIDLLMEILIHHPPILASLVVTAKAAPCRLSKRLDALRRLAHEIGES
jgi:hypothetical protein